MKKITFLIFCFIANNLFSQFLTENYSNLNNWNSTNANPNVHGVNGGVLRWNASYHGRNGANAISSFNQNARIFRSLNNNLFNQSNFTIELDFFINSYATFNEAGIVVLSLTSNNSHFYGLGNGFHNANAARTCTQNEGISLTLGSERCGVSLKRDAPAVAATQGDPCTANINNHNFNFPNRLTASTWYYLRFNKNGNSYRIQIFNDSSRQNVVFERLFCDTTNFDSLNFIQQGNHPLAGGGNSNNPAAFTDQDRIRMSLDNLRIWNTSVPISPLGQISIDATLDKICSGASSSLTANPAGMTYRWLTTPIQNSRSISVNQPGIYSVVVSSNGCSDTARISIAMDSINAIIVSSKDTTCEGDSVVLSAQPAGMTYSWNTTPPQTSSNIVVREARNYSVTVTNSSGCTGIANKAVVFQNCCPQECYWTLNGNNNVTAKNFIGSKNNADFKIRTNNIERAIVKSDGKVGIGTSTPTEQLHTNQGVRFEGLTTLDSPARIVVQDPTGKLFWSSALSFKGPKGDKGDQGIQGVKGDKGDKGDTGSQGVKGDKGDQGVKGDKGDQGLAGLQGPRGFTGATGPQGPIGLTGPQGPVGPSPVITNTLTLTGNTLTSNVSGIRSNTITLPSATGNFWNLNGNSNATSPPNVAVGTALPSTSNFIGTTSNHPAVLATNNLERIRITADGNIGIGTNTPSNLQSWGRVLDVSNEFHSKIITQANNRVRSGLYSHGLTRNGYWGFQMNSGGAGAVGTESNHPFAIITNDLARISVTNSGNIGIGTTTPSTQLHTTGTVRFTGVIEDNSFSRVMVQNTTGDVRWREASSLASGNTTNSCGTTNQIPRLTGTNTYSCSQLFDNTTTVGINKSTGFTYTWNGGLTGSSLPATSGTVRLDVDGVIRGTAIIATSDKTLKTNIENITNASQIVAKLIGKSYFWTKEFQKETGVDNGKHYGFLAQDLAEVLPNVVMKDVNGRYGVEYQAIIPILVEAIKEQQTQIDALKFGKTSSLKIYTNEDSELLKKENETLKNKVNSLESKFDLLEKTLMNICESGCAGLENITPKESQEIDILYQSIPNPTDDIAMINYYLAKNYQDAFIQISDLNGRIIEKITLNPKHGNGSIKVSLGKYAAQNYMYYLIIEEKIVDSKKMTIIR
jgi:hypothetical protein